MIIYGKLKRDYLLVKTGRGIYFKKYNNIQKEKMFISVWHYYDRASATHMIACMNQGGTRTSWKLSSETKYSGIRNSVFQINVDDSRISFLTLAPAKDLGSIYCYAGLLITLIYKTLLNTNYIYTQLCVLKNNSLNYQCLPKLCSWLLPCHREGKENRGLTLHYQNSSPNPISH